MKQREHVVSPFIIAYETGDDLIVILAVLRGQRHRASAIGQAAFWIALRHRPRAIPS